MNTEVTPKPTLTLRIGVTGHRPNKLTGANLSAVREKVDEILTTLQEEAQALQDSNNAEHEGSAYRLTEKPDIRLVTSLAEGSDILVAEAAAARNFALNVVLPYPITQYEGDFSKEGLARFRSLTTHNSVHSVCALDFSGSPDDSAAYQTAGEVMLEHTDVLIAIWDGAAAAGPGGTAEVVQKAKAQRRMVIWITLDGIASVWRESSNVVDPKSDGSWQEVSDNPDNSDGLMAALTANILAPPKGRYARRRLDDFFSESLRASSYACGYKLLKGVLVGGDWHPRVDYGLSEKRNKEWTTTLGAAYDLGGTSFSTQVSEQLKERWLYADCLAIHYAHRFRSAFVTNFLLAAAAVFAGLMAIPVWDSLAGKAVLVTFELVFIGTILWQTRTGHNARWQERWLDYRNVAEALRPARLSVLIANSPTRPGQVVGGTPGQDWVAWYIRAVLREITPPTGVVDSHALRRVIDVAVGDEIDDQLQYHADNEQQLKALDHKLEVVGDVFLWLTLVSGASFILAFSIQLGMEMGGIAKILKPWTTFFGGVLPVFGAAMFAIRATGDFRTSAHQSSRMLRELRNVRMKLVAERDAPIHARVNQLLSETTRSMTDDLRIWALIYSERTLTPGF